jgi:hypothetical protein
LDTASSVSIVYFLQQIEEWLAFGIDQPNIFQRSQ